MPIDATDRILIHGIHLFVTPALRDAIHRKAARLFRHEPRLLRVQIDVACCPGRTRMFLAKARLLLPGPDLAASVTTEDAYKSVDLLVDKLARMLRKRATASLRTRADGDLRDVAPMGTR